MFKFRSFLTLTLAALLLAPVAAQQFRQPPPYRILVVNDDGVRAPGIAAVAQALQAIGTPIIVGPADNQTGKGHSIVTSETVFREDFTLPNWLHVIRLMTTITDDEQNTVRNNKITEHNLEVSGDNTNKKIDPLNEI